MGVAQLSKIFETFNYELILFSPRNLLISDVSSLTAMFPAEPKPKRIKKPVDLKVLCWICGAAAADHLHYGEQFLAVGKVDIDTIGHVQELFAATAAEHSSEDLATGNMSVWTRVTYALLRLIIGNDMQ